MNNQAKQEVNELGHALFWLLWTVALLIIPIYFFTFAFEVEAVKNNNTFSYFSPIIGFIVLILQITLSVISYKQMKQKISLSRPFLTLLGGTILIGFVWFGGCSMMGPLHL